MKFDNAHALKSGTQNADGKFLALSGRNLRRAARKFAHLRDPENRSSSKIIHGFTRGRARVVGARELARVRDPNEVGDSRDIYGLGAINKRRAIKKKKKMPTAVKTRNVNSRRMRRADDEDEIYARW